jgi:hypothetical protein
VRFTFTRQGGFVSYCDELTVDQNGEVHYRNTCTNSSLSGTLSATDQAFVAGLAGRVGRYRYDQPPTAGDSLALGLSFYGDGPAAGPSAGEQARLLDIALSANDRLRSAQAGGTALPINSLEDVRRALADAAGDRNQLRTAIGAYLALPEIRAQTEPDAAGILQALLAQALVYPGSTAAVEVRRLDPEGQLVLVNHPAPTITLYSPEGWVVLTEGTHIVDARLDGARLGVISAYESTQAVASYTLLERSGAGWELLWSSASRPDWQAVDGGAAFSGPGLDRLNVAGLTLSPMAGEADAPVHECAALCPRRVLSATWTLAPDGRSYSRPSTLAPPAPGEPLDAVLWELTVPDEYAVAFEFVRRLRAGDTPGARALASDDAVVATAIEFGLDRRAVTLNNQVYQLVFSASRPDLGQVRLQPFGLRELPDGQRAQAQFEGAYTLAVGLIAGRWQVQRIVR